MNQQSAIQLGITVFVSVVLAVGLAVILNRGDEEEATVYDALITSDSPAIIRRTINVLGEVEMLTNTGFVVKGNNASDDDPDTINVNVTESTVIIRNNATQDENSDPIIDVDEIEVGDSVDVVIRVDEEGKSEVFQVVLRD